ncbi:sialate O-acetylesterase [Spirosoma telluris]|uniref:sialate O-acetylesterase n=1 Tax=Spirosoma telluris TaxID=2183553 RepID=UPI002FC2EFE5
MYRTLFLLLCSGLLPFLVNAQLQVSFPVSRVVLQRNSSNEAIIHITGNFSKSVDRIEARVQARDGMGTSTDWKTIQTNPGGGIYAGDLTIRGGWYDLQVRGMYGDQLVNSTVVERVGVGEVFIIAGQSNAQGVYDDMASASDDRVNCLNYFDPTESQADPSIDVFNRFTHLDQGTRIAPRGLGTWCWGRLGDLLTQRLNVPILFFNAAYTGTAIRNWRESIERGRAESIYVPGTFYADGQPYANLRQAIQFYSHMLGVRAILWHQGEAENFVHTSYESYVNDLGFIINRSRQDSNKNIAWMVARASYTGDSAGGRAEVIAAQNQVITSIPNVYAGPSTDGIQIPRQRPPRTEITYDDVHFDVNGLQEVANAWNNSLNDSFFASSIPQPPAQAPTMSVACSTTNQLSISVNGSFASVNWNSGDTGSTIVKGGGRYQAKIKDGTGNVLISPLL